MRKPHIVHVEYGDISESGSFADCSEFPVETRDTLILYGSKETCPIGGKHFSESCGSNPVLQVGCTEKHEMLLVRDCSRPIGGIGSDQNNSFIWNLRRYKLCCQFQKWRQRLHHCSWQALSSTFLHDIRVRPYPLAPSLRPRLLWRHLGQQCRSVPFPQFHIIR